MKTAHPPEALSRLQLTPDKVRALTGNAIPPKAAITSDLGKWLDSQKIKIHGRVACFQVEVTPAIAARWLKFNTGNRKPSKAKIHRFAAAIKAGRWTLNGETLKFSITGRLIDGQSRLMAIIDADAPALLEIRAGLPDIAQESMDTGELRKGSHTLEMMGEANPGVLAPALKQLWCWQRGLLGGHKFGVSRVMENAEIKSLLSQHDRLKQSVGWVVSDGNKIRNMLALSEGAFFHYMCGRSDSKLRDPFFEALVDGIALTKLSPVYHLREKLLADRASQARIGKFERLALFIKAWNATVRGEKMTMLRYTAKGPNAESFPEFENLKPDVSEKG